jgi:ribulose-5-phosphate 4-epimerase/fuculose-1-phosphate aldolase
VIEASDPDGLLEQRTAVAEACRILAARGLATGLLGHISLRVGPDHLLIRCRGPRERGLPWTEPSDVKLVDLDGVAHPQHELAPWVVPNELPIHAEVLRARPDVACVVHAHPPAVIAADLAGLGIRPIVGAYDIPGTRMAREGVPVYERSVLIRTKELGQQMCHTLGDKAVVVLRGHGLTSTGATLEEAVLRAISVDVIAQMSLQVVSAGGVLVDVPERDLEHLPDLGNGLNLATAWRHEQSRLGDPRRS